MATQTPPPRAAQATRRRDQILDAATTVLVDPGYRAVSLRDIASAAGLSHPGLLRHFRSKDDILLAIVDRFEREAERLVDEAAPAGVIHPSGGVIAPAVELARRNAGIPGYLSLFTALAGEATSARHPAHARMRERYARMRRDIAHGFASEPGAELGAGRDPGDEALRLIAGWDGAQLLQLYLPDEVDVVSVLERHARRVALPAGHDGRASGRPVAPRSWSPVSAPPAQPPGGRAGGRAVGRARRERILAEATALFAAEGYGDTSMRTVAERAGVSKSTLFHHYATKEDLLRAVLVARDAAVPAHFAQPPARGGASLLRALPEGARRNADESPGLIEVYSVLAGEATAGEHPAHEYFASRLRGALAGFTALFEAAAADGELAAGRDPADEAVWLLALWDGLQIQWLYDRDGVDVAAQLAAHLADVLSA